MFPYNFWDVIVLFAVFDLQFVVGVFVTLTTKIGDGCAVQEPAILKVYRMFDKCDGVIGPDSSFRLWKM